MQLHTTSLLTKKLTLTWWLSGLQAETCTSEHFYFYKYKLKAFSLICILCSVSDPPDNLCSDHIGRWLLDHSWGRGWKENGPIFTEEWELACFFINYLQSCSQSSNHQWPLSCVLAGKGESAAQDTETTSTPQLFRSTSVCSSEGSQDSRAAETAVQLLWFLTFTDRKSVV